jgi:cellulose biosynthesis protein BcsQ
MNKEPKMVLFYSFKGGVGRTQLMLNSAKHLASKGKKVLMVDLDVHAPGLSYLKLEVDKQQEEDYLLNFILNHFAKEDTSKQVVTREISPNLYLAPIYDVYNTTAYHQLLIDFSKYSYSIREKKGKKLENNMTLSDLITKSIKNKLLKTGEYDYIFLDSRTGFTEIGDILFSKEIDLKVLVSAYNTQNIEGMNSVLQLIDRDLKEKHSILRVLSLKPNKCDTNQLEQLKTKANLDDNKELKDRFIWNNIMEIDYASVIVTNDFEIWENLDNKELYKKQVIDIANQIEEICVGKKFEL